MRPEIEDWERKHMVRNERTLYRTSPELELKIQINDPSNEKQRLVEELFIDCFNKAQEIMEQDD